MPLTFTPFHAEHLDYLVPHEDQQGEYHRLKGPVGRLLAAQSAALTAWAGVRCVAVGGIFPVWEGRAETWLIVGHDAGRNFLPVVRKMRDMIDTHPARRVEMTVKSHNVHGNRLARQLGFDKPEAYLRAYHPDGSDMLMYAKVRTWPQQ